MTGMHTKHRAYAAVAVSLALLAGSSIGQPSTQGQTSPQPASPPQRLDADSAPRLSVAATAYRDVLQDRITVTLYAERESPQPAVGQTQVSELLGPVIERLRSDPGLELQGSGYRTDPVWQDGRIVAWRTRGSVQVTAKPSDDFNRLIGELATQLNIESVAHSLSREARLAVEQELIDEAVAAFGAKARTAARALGFTRYSVRKVSIDGSRPEPPQPVLRMAMSRAESDAARAPLPSVEGKTTVTVTVSGTVALER